jgi:hypothetical protein
MEDLCHGETLKNLRAAGENTKVIKKIKSRFEVQGDKEDHEVFEVREVEFYDRLSALEKLAKIYAMMTDVQKLEGNLKMYGQEAPIDEV